MKKFLYIFLIFISCISYSQIKGFSLSQNYPNPFNPTTKIYFDLHLNGNVKLEVFDVVGRNVQTLINEYKTAGTYEISFNASNLPGGVYFYKLSSGNWCEIRRMVLLK